MICKPHATMFYLFYLELWKYIFALLFKKVTHFEIEGSNTSQKKLVKGSMFTVVGSL